MAFESEKLNVGGKCLASQLGTAAIKYIKCALNVTRHAKTIVFIRVYKGRAKKWPKIFFAQVNGCSATYGSQNLSVSGAKRTPKLELQKTKTVSKKLNVVGRNV